MKSNPYREDDFSRASEYLRLALALLSRHQVPPSPLNFRLGYDVVAGKNETLKAALGELLTRDGEVSNDDLWEIYRRFFVQEVEAFRDMRKELQRIVGNLQRDFHRSGQDLSDYSSTLSQFAELLETPAPPEVMSAEVKKVITDTRTMEESQHRLESQMSSILSEVSSLRKELEQVKEESITDALTNISNRKAFDAALERTVQTAREHKVPFSILLIDIDRFKLFNDTHGHLVGDKVLRFVASTLKRCVKGKDMAARFGGEEFAVILPGTLLTGAEVVAEQIRREISAGDLKDKSEGRSYGKIAVSIGVAQFKMSDLPNDLVHRADKALYLAKERGRNRIEKVA